MEETKGEKPGDVIASIETFPQKQKLMKSNSALKTTVAYKKVYIENGYCRETKKTDSKFSEFYWKKSGKKKQQKKKKKKNSIG